MVAWAATTVQATAGNAGPLAPETARNRPEDASQAPTLRTGMSAIVQIDTGKQNSLLSGLQSTRELEPQTRVAVSNASRNRATP